MIKSVDYTMSIFKYCVIKFSFCVTEITQRIHFHFDGIIKLSAGEVLHVILAMVEVISIMEPSTQHGRQSFGFIIGRCNR